MQCILWTFEETGQVEDKRRRKNYRWSTVSEGKSSSRGLTQDPSVWSIYCRPKPHQKWSPFVWKENREKKLPNDTKTGLKNNGNHIKTNPAWCVFEYQLQWNHSYSLVKTPWQWRCVSLLIRSAKVSLIHMALLLHAVMTTAKQHSCIVTQLMWVVYETFTAIYDPLKSKSRLI